MKNGGGGGSRTRVPGGFEHGVYTLSRPVLDLGDVGAGAPVPPIRISFWLLENRQKHEGSSAVYTPCELSGSRPAWTSRSGREEFLAGAGELDYVVIGIYKPGTLLRSQVPSPACNHALRASGRIRNTPFIGKNLWGSCVAGWLWCVPC